MDPTTGVFPIAKSNMYQFWLAQQEEIAKNRWYMSEQAGHDVGQERARWVWEMQFRSAWISGLKASGLYPN
jgi:hypothetical protein